MKAIKRFIIRCLLWTSLVIFLLGLTFTLPFRWINPPSTSFILQDARVSQPFLGSRWTPIEDIAPSLQIAVVAAEDQLFPSHHGFDFKALGNAIKQGGSKGGASTMSQQLSKNLYLWSGRSLLRKGIEAYLTVWIESTWPKRRILEVYLNVVEFGPGIYGVSQAAQVFFNKAPGQLTVYEASLMAAVLPSPKKMSVAKPSAYVAARAQKIRRFIKQLGGASYLPWLM